MAEGSRKFAKLDGGGEPNALCKIPHLDILECDIIFTMRFLSLVTGTGVNMFILTAASCEHVLFIVNMFSS